MTSFELLTGRENSQLVSYKNFLIDSKTLESFLRLQNDAKKDGFNLEIISAFRNFERQLKIWNDKAQGQRQVLDKNENLIDLQTISQADLLNAIMHFSAIPGASRHHWGTDIDIFDANKKNASDVTLTQSECIEGGEFCDLHLWLDEKIAGNESYGFFRPYENDLGGVAQEKWHLSFSPLSQKYFSEFSLDLFIKNIEHADIRFKDHLLSRSQEFYQKYVKNISFPPF